MLDTGNRDLELLDQLRSDLGRYPRMHGYYLLNLVPLPSTWREDEEASLTSAFEALDDQSWERPELRPKDQLWADYEVNEAKARAHIVAALVGGEAVGHTRETIPAPVAQELWEKFRGLFSLNTRFYVGLGFGDSAYAFQQGVVAVDDQKAGCLGVIEGD